MFLKNVLQPRSSASQLRASTGWITHHMGFSICGSSAQNFPGLHFLSYALSAPNKLRTSFQSLHESNGKSDEVELWKCWKPTTLYIPSKTKSTTICSNQRTKTTISKPKNMSPALSLSLSHPICKSQALPKSTNREN